MKIVLFIETADSKNIRVGIEKDGEKTEIAAPAIQSNAQMVLPLIEKLLKTQKLKLTNITEIQVNTGPGSFTGLRVGIAIAQSLGMLLSVPVNGNLPGQPIEPSY